MKFFHVYNEHAFEGLVKNGLLNKNSGFKIQHVFRLPEDMKFNRLAAKGTKLHHMIKEENIPFYVDRIAGGTTYHKYEFDKELIKEYENILGDWFLGFQLHETGTNLSGDWCKIINAMGHKGPYDIDKMRALLTNPHKLLPDGTALMDFSQGSAEEYAKRKYAETPEEYLEEMRDLFARRMSEVDGHILPCDSYHLMTKIQDEMGMKTFMPEVGCQILLMRLEVALARGMAKASRKTWGTYYECWRPDKNVKPSGYCMPCFNTDPFNEWYAKQDIYTDDFTTYGENGGSSRLLQNRIYYYSLMSGADYLSEEWGLNCSYTDMQEFTLSPYGELKKAFIRDAENYQDVKAKIPFAIVLPKAFSCVELGALLFTHEIGVHRAEYLGRPIDKEKQDYYGHVEDVLKLFFARYGEVYGNEGHVITNSRFGDVADVIYEDASDEALKHYEYLIDATKDGDFARAKAGKGLCILESKDVEKLAVMMEKLIPELMPVMVSGLTWVASVDNQNRNYLSIFNNEGNERSIYKGDTIHAEADRTVTVTFKKPVDLRVVKEGSRAVNIQRVDDCTYNVEIPGTSFVIVQF